MSRWKTSVRGGAARALPCPLAPMSAALQLSLSLRCPTAHHRPDRRHVNASNSSTKAPKQPSGATTAERLVDHPTRVLHHHAQTMRAIHAAGCVRYTPRTPRSWRRDDDQPHRIGCILRQPPPPTSAACDSRRRTHMPNNPRRSVAATERIRPGHDRSATRARLAAFAR